MINGYGLCLNQWLEDENIKTELRLLIKISSLTADKGFCYASNSFFAEYFKTSEVTISKQIKKLESLNYIEIEYERRGAEVLKRFIRLKKTLTDDYQKLKPTIKENFKDNNTSINNTSIIKENKKENLFSQLIKQYEHYDIYEKIALDFIAYRKLIKKPLKTILPIKQFIDSLIELSKLGYSFDYCIEQMKSNEWQTVKKDYIHKQTKPQQKSRAESNREFIEKHYGINEDGNIIDTEII